MWRRTKTSIALLALLALAGVSLWQIHPANAEAKDDGSPAAQSKTVEVTTQFLIVSRLSDPFAVKPIEPIRPPAEDWLALQEAILRSPAIVMKATRLPEIQKLKEFAGRDAITTGATIIERLSVRRPLGKGSLFEMSLRGFEAADGVAVLSGIVQTYQALLENVYKSECDKALVLLTDSRDTLYTKLADREQRLLEFRSRAMAGQRSSAEIKAVLAAAASRSAELSITRKEMEGRLAWVEKVAADPQTRPLAQLKANEWAARMGFDKLPNAVKQSKDLVQMFQESLKQELEESKSVGASLSQLAVSERSELIQAEARQAIAEGIQADIARMRKLVNGIQERLDEMDLRRNFHPYEVQVIAPPAPKSPSK